MPTSRKKSVEKSVPAIPVDAAFRRLALAFEGVEERAHMGHPDFRVSGRVFASIKSDRRHAAVKLTTAERDALVERAPAVFSAESGAWGRQGWTRIVLTDTNDELLGEALTLAWRGVRG